MASLRPEKKETLASKATSTEIEVDSMRVDETMEAGTGRMGEREEMARETVDSRGVKSVVLRAREA